MIRALALLLVFAAGQARALEAVSNFDAERYLGTWHEIATIPAWFQRNCAYATTATYTATSKPDRIGVLNACRTADGDIERAYGQARFTGSPDTASLRVTFLKLFGSYRWFASGAYIVFALDENYQWTAVGHPSLDYGWILAREPELAPSTLAVIEAAFHKAGYDTCRLMTSAEKLGDQRRPLCAAVEGQ